MLVSLFIKYKKKSDGINLAVDSHRRDKSIGREKCARLRDDYGGERWGQGASLTG